MNLPADKVKLLSQYDSEKKWDLICDQVCPLSISHKKAMVTLQWCSQEEAHKYWTCLFKDVLKKKMC